MANKTAKGLVEYAIAQLGKPYWYGTYGQAASKSLYDYKKYQYPDYYWWDYAGETEVKVHDCIGLIKGYIWSKSPTDNDPVYVKSQDKSDGGMYEICTKKGDISTMPEVPGTLVFMKGHVGVYIGDGYVVEARGHAFGVVKTKLASRGWTKWGYCPYVTYGEEDDDMKLPMIKKSSQGDTVKALQAMLVGYGYNLGNFGENKNGVDGDFGTATHNAVVSFQKKNGLDPDGIVGPLTWNKLLGV